MTAAADTPKIGLISPYSNLSAIGLRHISSSLQRAGYATRMIFLPDPDELYYKAKSPPSQYTEAVLDQVCDLCADLDLIGITLMSNYVGRARSLTDAVHERLGIPVVWGGIHPTVRPEESLKWADFVCVGEGEDAIVELVHSIELGASQYDIQNIWWRDAQGQIHANPNRPITQNLDELALPDYDLDRQFILNDGQIEPLTPPLLAHHLMHNFARQTRLAYMLSATRGCPFRCTFCCDNALSKMFAGWSKLRRRSPQNLLAEIQVICAVLPQLEAVMLIDSTFLAVSDDWLEEFANLYRREVGLPFFIQTTPGSIKEHKLQLLVEAGLADVGMGLQSGSARMRSLYHRFETNEQIVESGRLLQKHRAAIPYPSYDVISDNPYESYEDQLETLNLLYRLPRPHLLHFFSLTFYPGTDMYELAKTDGFISDDEVDIYAKSYIKLQPNYYNFVLWCLHRNLPHWVLLPMIQPISLRLFSFPIFAWLFTFIYRLIAMTRGLDAQFKHFRQVRTYLRPQL
ncbi:radical SAM protein [Caldilinea sp.]|uniref:B12-binding domain-containing radical SAM protein n=1 Tax=Caldilinea sp. TaxID=2293560 RepID=UPI002C681F29|nr:B12-binding domain-containing radical SAM protein [Anaerolineales bacterium]HQY90544.1 radical SAM protein [Caldilinea sp.]HRA65273.1 radical SAM protein [Caldilinea sp.]